MKYPLLTDERFVRIAAPVMVGLLFLVIWQLTVNITQIPPYILPGPLTILNALVENGPSLFKSLMMTMEVTFLAFFISIVLGVTASLLFIQSRWIEISFFPYAILMQ
ncbi:hypothetical protein P4S72_15055 [Vibrio sp. PP-XX7]